MKKTYGVVAFAGLMVVAQHSFAEAPYSVSYSKQELATAQGLLEVNQRIDRVSRDHCADYLQARRLKQFRTCRIDVANDLVAKINHPQLTQLHQGDRNVRVAADQPARNNAG